jgi:hypothetical protein
MMLEAFSMSMKADFIPRVNRALATGSTGMFWTTEATSGGSVWWILHSQGPMPYGERLSGGPWRLSTAQTGYSLCAL